MQMVKVAVAELQGAALDWVVAYALPDEILNPMRAMRVDRGYVSSASVWRPSTDWAQGGYLIGEYGILFEDGGDNLYCAWGGKDALPDMYGETHLIAACRAIVAKHFGEHVEVPASLVQGGNDVTATA